MIRFLKLDLSQQAILSFRCGRVVFSDVMVPVPTISYLTDYSFLYENLMKYKRRSGEEVNVARNVCAKCEGYGFYDWVALLKGDIDEEDEIWTESREIILAKNENPITKVFVSEISSQTVNIYYQSAFEKDELTHRCKLCFGTGIKVHYRKIIEYTPSELIENLHYPKKPIATDTTSPFLGWVKSLIFKGEQNDKRI